MITLVLASLILFVATAAKPVPRTAQPVEAPCDVSCLEAKNAALQKLAVKRLKLLSAREHRIVHLLTRLRGTADRRSASTSSGAHGSSARNGSPRSIICAVFGSHCSEALRVAWCESRMNVYARNGQYLGLFQFGSFARSQYGFAWDARTQTRAAYRYYLDAGWSPWTCRP